MSKPQRVGIVVLATALAIVTTGCAADTDASENDIESAVASFDVLDGWFLQVEATGNRYEPVQGHRPEDPPALIAVFAMAATHDASAERMRIHWQRQSFDPVIAARREYDEIINGDAGFIEGADVVLGFADGRPMTSDRLAPVRRQQRLLHPHLLIAAALREGRNISRAGSASIDGVEHLVLAVEAVPRPIRLFIDIRRGRISRVATRENDHPFGDVDLVIDFSDWRRDGLPMAYPRRAVMRWDGKVIHEEERSRVALIRDVPGDTFALPQKLPADPVEAERGLTSEQWTQRALAIGAPLHLEQRIVTPVDIAPNLVLFAGGTHYSLAIADPSGSIVLEPHLFEERSLAVIEAIAARWPDKKITHLVLSHYHHDHSGGIRTYAAANATLVINAGDRSFVDSLLTRPHQVRPDRLSAAQVAPEIIAVGDDPLTLGSGDTQIVLYRVANTHAAENLIAYFPAHKLLFNADLYIPGIAPPNTPLPEPFGQWGIDLRNSIAEQGLDVEWMLGPHGATQPRPFAEFLAHVELSAQE